MPVINNSCVVKIRNIWWVCNTAEGGCESGGINVGGGVGVGDGNVEGEDGEVGMGGGVTGRGWCVLEEVVGC